MEYNKVNKAAVATINQYGGDSNWSTEIIISMEINCCGTHVHDERQEALQKAGTTDQNLFAGGGVCGEWWWLFYFARKKTTKWKD